MAIASLVSIATIVENNKINEIHVVGEYGIKAMFAEKYSIAYTACLDDISQGEENPTVNASVYQDNKLVNIDLTYEEFLALYRAVKDLYRPIEKKYQEYLAEFSNNPKEKRLKQIIENDIF